MSQSLVRRQLIAQGTGGSSDVFNGTLARDASNGITPSTVSVWAKSTAPDTRVYGTGTLIAQDDGAGNLVPEPGHFLAASTINYATGAVHVEENGVNNEFNGTWCCLDYSCEIVAPDDFDVVNAGNGDISTAWCSRAEHVDVAYPVVNHGRYCIQRYRDPVNVYHSAQLFLKKGAGWNTADDVSVAMLWWRDGIRTGGGSTFSDAPHQNLVARYSAGGAYYCGILHSFGGPWVALGNAAFNNQSLILTSGNVSKFPQMDIGKWNGLRLDVQTVGSDVRLEVFAVQGSESCDLSPRLSDLPWSSEFAVWHRNGVATPEVISGSPTTVQSWNKTATHLTGKIGFQFGGVWQSSAALSTDKGYISSFQAKKI